MRKSRQKVKVGISLHLSRVEITKVAYALRVHHRKLACGREIFYSSFLSQTHRDNFLFKMRGILLALTTRLLILKLPVITSRVHDRLVEGVNKSKNNSMCEQMLASYNSDCLRHQS